MIHYVIAPFLDMRESPSREGKIVSQALFGERVRVERRSADWVLIQTPDSYSGWVLENFLCERPSPYREDQEVSRLIAHLYPVPDVEYGPFLTLPHGTRLAVIDESDPRWVEVVLPDGKKGYIQKGDLAPEPFELTSFCQKFLGLPYTWGGRSSFGFDCSGFAQMVYRKIGLQLSRDAKDQFADPRGRLVPIDGLEKGDLIFWGNKKEEIRHVAISFGGIDFIHTSSKENRPYLRLSSLLDFEWSGKEGAIYSFRAAKRFDRP